MIRIHPALKAKILIAKLRIRDVPADPAVKTPVDRRRINTGRRPLAHAQTIGFAKLQIGHVPVVGAAVVIRIIKIVGNNQIIAQLGFAHIAVVAVPPFISDTVMPGCIMTRPLIAIGHKTPPDIRLRPRRRLRLPNFSDSACRNQYKNPCISFFHFYSLSF